jgi:hypothetical protein
MSNGDVYICGNTETHDYIGYKSGYAMLPANVIAGTQEVMQGIKEKFFQNSNMKVMLYPPNDEHLKQYPLYTVNSVEHYERL